MLDRKDKKLFVFAPEKFYNNIKVLLQDTNKYRITNTPKVYHSPVFNMQEWDEKLEGKKWKKLRNIKNKFTKSYNTEFIPSKEIDTKKLMDVIIRWRKNRPKTDVTYYMQMYSKFIKNNFEGTDIARSVVIDGEPCTITAGWRIPNSRNYYSAIGLYNYRCPGLGEIANIDELTHIKKEKYMLVDFGDSSGSLLQFKKKFVPDHFYKTYWFYIAKNKA